MGFARYKIDDPRVSRSDEDREKLRIFLKDVVNRARQAAESRNGLIHATWFPEHYVDGSKMRKDTTVSKISLKLGRGFAQSSQAFKIKDIVAVTKGIEKALHGLGESWALFGMQGLLEGFYRPQAP